MIYKKLKKKLSLLLVLALLVTLIPAQVTYAVDPNSVLLDNGFLRFAADGGTTSISEYGTLEGPQYKNAENKWEELTLDYGCLGFLVEEGGDGTNIWNANGDITYADDLYNTLASHTLVVNKDGYDAGTQTGVVKTTLTTEISGKDIQIDNEYTLLPDKSYLKVKTKLTNISGVDMTNVRYMPYARDDYIGDRDAPSKTKGNIVEGAFVEAPTKETQSKALKVYSGTSSVIFYSTDETANVVLGNISMTSTIGGRIYDRDPADVNVQYTSNSEHYYDNAYALYFRLNDLANNESDEITWYYAAGTIEDLEDVFDDLSRAGLPGEAYLDNLTVQNGTLSPAFTTSGSVYATVLPVGTTTANITPESSGNIKINDSAVVTTATQSNKRCPWTQ